MLVDYERAWLAFKETIVAKPAHGQRDLLAEMARIEVQSSVGEEGYDPSPARRPSRQHPASQPPREVARSG